MRQYERRGASSRFAAYPSELVGGPIAPIAANEPEVVSLRRERATTGRMGLSGNLSVQRSRSAFLVIVFGRGSGDGVLGVFW